MFKNNNEIYFSAPLLADNAMTLKQLYDITLEAKNKEADLLGSIILKASNLMVSFVFIKYYCYTRI